MRLRSRIGRAERTLGRHADVTWQEAYAAGDRIRAAVVERLKALAEGRPAPERNLAQQAEDEETLRRWRRQRGIREPDLEGARERLLAKLNLMAERLQE